MEKVKKKKYRYIKGLDSFRALGVLGIILYHLIPQAVPGGFLGVPLFFLLSGYLLTDHLKVELQGKSEIKFFSYFFRRVKSLYPMLLLMFLFTIPYMFFLQKNLLEKAAGAVVSSLLLVNNWWQVLNGSSYFEKFTNQSPYTHLWFLGVLGQLYLFLPLIFILLQKLFKNKNGKKFLTFFVLSIVSAVLFGLFFSPENPNRSYYGTDTRAFSFFIGSAMAYFWPSYRLKEKINRNSRNVFKVLGFLSLLGIIACFLLVTDHSSSVYYGGMYAFTLLSGLLLMIVVHPGAEFGKLFQGKVVTYLGSRSYGIYLMQYPVMVFYEQRLNVAKNPYIHALIEFILIIMVTELAHFLLKQLVKPKNKYFFLGGSAVTLVLLGISIYGLVNPPKVVNESQTELESTLAKNKELIEQKTDEQEQTTRNSTVEETLSEEQIATLKEEFGLNEKEIAYAYKTSGTAVGDSVLLSTAEDLIKVFPKMNVDGKIGRQVYQAPEILKEMAATGQLHDTVLIGLGTNGTFNSSYFEEIMTLLKGKEVYWVNVHAPNVRWQNTVNDTLNELGKKYKNFHLIDWNKEAQNHPEWFYDDQIHPKPTGVKAYIKLVVEKMSGK